MPCRPFRGEAISIALQILVQIAPFRIEPVNQFDLLPARTGFYLLLASDGAGRIVYRFIIDELGYIIAVGKSPHRFLAVLIDSGRP